MLSDNKFENTLNTLTDLKNDWQNRYSKHYLNIFGTPKLLITHGQGSKVWDSNGNEYIDLLGGIAVNSLGHNHSRITKTISQNAEKLMHISNFFTTSSQILLAEKLSKLVGIEHNAKVLFTNSGTESVECALKIAKKFANTKKEPDAKIIAIENSFHGRSLGALSTTSKEKYRNPFKPLIPNVEFIKPNISEIESVFNENVCCVILECIQGEGGVKPLSTEFISKVRELCNKNKALMIVDEVQTGIGRTGKWFSFEHHKVVPDIITLAKGLGAGFPIGAVITLNNPNITDVSAILEPGDHGTTFGGNPLACAVANEVISIIEDDYLLSNASNAFSNIKELIESQKIAQIKEIRGSGLLIGIELKSKIANEIANRSLENGVIVNAVNESTLRLAPALNISPIDLHKALRTVLAIIKDFEHKKTERKPTKNSN